MAILRITIKVEGEPKEDNRGYEQRETLASFAGDKVDFEVWDVYREAVNALTPTPPPRYDLVED